MVFTAADQLVVFSLPLLQSPDAEASSTTEVDLFMSTQRIKVLNADSQVGEKKIILVSEPVQL